MSPRHSSSSHLGIYQMASIEACQVKLSSFPEGTAYQICPTLPQFQQVLNKMFHVEYMAKMQEGKSTCFPCKGPRFASQHPYGGSQLPSSRGLHVASWLLELSTFI